MKLTNQDVEDIEDILRRRANEIASFKTDYCDNPHHLGSVELALTREVARLRALAEKINPLIDLRVTHNTKTNRQRPTKIANLHSYSVGCCPC